MVTVLDKWFLFTSLSDALIGIGLACCSYVVRQEVLGIDNDTVNTLLQNNATNTSSGCSGQSMRRQIIFISFYHF